MTQMTDTDRKPDAQKAGEAADASAEPPRISEEAACEEAIEQLKGSSAEIERLEAEKSDLTDRLLRLAADMDNLRRRTERELADARKYAVAKFAGDMLVVGDNLQRALAAVAAENRAAENPAYKALHEGVEMTGREMERLLERNGVTKIAPKGERFDPNKHQAMFEVPDPSVPPGTVVQVIQDGYTIGDRVLRAAMVGVAKGGAEAGRAETEAAAEAQQ